MNRSRRSCAAALTVCVLAGLAACGPAATPTGAPASSHAATAPSPDATPTPATSGTPTGTAGTLGGTGTGTSPPAPATGTTVTTPPASPVPGGSCLRGVVRVLYPGADNPLRSVCVHVGTEITITLSAVPSYKWSPVLSSSPGVVLMTSNHAADAGTLVEVARAQSPGTATLTAADTFTPDPHGPPSRLWQLLVRVVA